MIVLRRKLINKTRRRSARRERRRMPGKSQRVRSHPRLKKKKILRIMIASGTIFKLLTICKFFVFKYNQI